MFLKIENQTGVSKVRFELVPKIRPLSG
jgi:hypothetical protein